MPRAPGSGRPPYLLGFAVSIDFSRGAEQQRLDWVFAHAAFGRHFFWRDSSRWANLSRRVAGIRDARPQLLIPPSQVLDLGAHPFSAFGEFWFDLGSACL